MWCWHPGYRPGLLVLASGTWRYASVHARHEHADGRIVYFTDLQADRMAPDQGEHVADMQVTSE